MLARGQVNAVSAERPVQPGAMLPARHPGAGRDPV